MVQTPFIQESQNATLISPSALPSIQMTCVQTKVSLSALKFVSLISPTVFLVILITLVISPGIIDIVSD